jgi:hypothetical protein
MPILGFPINSNISAAIFHGSVGQQTVSSNGDLLVNRDYGYNGYVSWLTGVQLDTVVYADNHVCIRDTRLYL